MVSTATPTATLNRSDKDSSVHPLAASSEHMNSPYGALKVELYKRSFNVLKPVRDGAIGVIALSFSVLVRGRTTCMSMSRTNGRVPLARVKVSAK